MKNKNLWAPWRTAYLESLEKNDNNQLDKPACFLCDYWAHPEKDTENLVLWRTENSLVLFNRFPYTGGHLLIAPKKHIASLENFTEEELLELMSLTRDAQKVLQETLNPHGFNVGMNISRCAGAGLPDHIHLHIVPRWNGDTNFMDVIGDTRVISVELKNIYKKMLDIAKELKLPTCLNK